MKTKELQYVTFEQAKKLKEIGFDYEVTHFYVKEDINKKLFAFWNHATMCINSEKNYNHKDYKGYISSPTVALALKWFRDEKNQIGYVSVRYAGNNTLKGFVGYINIGEIYVLADTYEAAESALLDKLLDILKKDNEK